ncbi:hypothetical protein [Pontimicrobium sp. IMCC45349]|uniref:hypothetical protein n=1 Tax=Pontimicrobium sp. IMCC45349 TaxID=3391574 RepID=UPI0039A360C5
MLKQRKNKRFNYTPRYAKDSEGNLVKDDASKSNGFAFKWQRAREANKNKGSKGFSLRFLILILVLLLICMYVLDKKYM